MLTIARVPDPAKHLFLYFERGGRPNSASLYARHRRNERGPDRVGTQHPGPARGLPIWDAKTSCGRSAAPLGEPSSIDVGRAAYSAGARREANLTRGTSAAAAVTRSATTNIEAKVRCSERLSAACSASLAAPGPPSSRRRRSSEVTAPMPE